MEIQDRTLQRLDNATLGDRASEALLDYIRTQNLQPGSGLPSEAKLTELLGVSRPVVREALRNLRGLGIVEIYNGRGAVVRELSAASLEVFFTHALQTVANSIIGLMELRTGLECEAAALAALRHTQEDAADMRAIVTAMSATVADPVRYSELDVELHIAISRASGNQLYLHMVQSIRMAMRDASLRGMKLRLDFESAGVVQQMHETIVEAILERDAEAAFAAMKRHMRAATSEFERQKQGGEGHR
jgi:GntR family transcriptional repressor for pyruvate dehydrogenase complex